MKLYNRLSLSIASERF